MKTWILNWWDVFRGSFWFIPVLLAMAALLLAIVMPETDRLLAGDVEDWFGVIVSTAPAARLSLSSIAGAMITVTGVVFSITIVALTLTASQFGSRLLRSLMEDVVTHLTLGSMVATSLYALLVLRVIVDREGAVFVPHLSVALAIVFTVGSMGMFIYFLHHVAQQMQAPNLIHAVALHLEGAVDRLYPEQIGTAVEDDNGDNLKNHLRDLGEEFAAVRANKLGFLQAIDGSGLLDTAKNADVVVYVPNRPGVFLFSECTLAQVWPKDKCDESLAEKLRDCFITGRRRTPRQDLSYAIEQLVEIAVRALSPGINDPFTAITCIDYLGAALVQLATRRIPRPVRLDETKTPRVLTETVHFGLAVRNAFRMILHFGRSNSAIHDRLLQVMGNIVPNLRRAQDSSDLHAELQHIRDVCENSVLEEADRIRIGESCDRLSRQLTDPR